MGSFCKRGEGGGMEDGRNVPTDGFGITDYAQVALGARHCHYMYS